MTGEQNSEAIDLVSPAPKTRRSPRDDADEMDDLALATAGLTIRKHRTAAARTPASTLRPTKRFQVRDEDEPDSGAQQDDTGAQENKDPQQQLVTPSRLGCFANLREELTCGVCLDVLKRPCTTPCGHTFCRSCLRQSLQHSSKCPKCRGPIISGAPLKINTALWNTIQLLFPTVAQAGEPATPEETARRSSSAGVQRNPTGRSTAFLNLSIADQARDTALQFLRQSEGEGVGMNAVLSRPFRPPRRTSTEGPPQASARPLPPRPHLRGASAGQGAGVRSSSAERLQALLDEMADRSRSLDAVASQPLSQSQVTLEQLLAEDDRDTRDRGVHARGSQQSAGVQVSSQAYNPFMRFAANRPAVQQGAANTRRSSVPSMPEQPRVTPHILAYDDSDEDGLQLLQQRHHSASQLQAPTHRRSADVPAHIVEHYRVSQNASDTGSDQADGRCSPMGHLTHQRDAWRSRDQVPAAPTAPQLRLPSVLQHSTPARQVAVSEPGGQPTFANPVTGLSISTARRDVISQPQVPIRAYDDWTGDGDPTAMDRYEDSPFFDADLARQAQEVAALGGTEEAAEDVTMPGSVMQPIVLSSDDEDTLLVSRARQQRRRQAGGVGAQAMTGFQTAASLWGFNNMQGHAHR